MPKQRRNEMTELNPLKCPVCDYVAKSERGLRMHNTQSHTGKVRKKRGEAQQLSPAQIKTLIEEWKNKTVKEFSELFGVSEATVNKTVKELRNYTAPDGSPVCPPSRGKPMVESIMTQLGFVLKKKEE